jgi:hypothetical protein
MKGIRDHKTKQKEEANQHTTTMIHDETYETGENNKMQVKTKTK